MKVVWLASYPRSGNTWLRFLLYAYLHGPITNTADVNRRIPPILRPLPPESREQPRLISKTHFLFSKTHPLFDRTAGIIHIRRHPKDILLSGFNYHSLNGATLNQATYARAFIAHRGDPEWARMGFGDWQTSIQSWLGAHAATPAGIDREAADRVPRVWTSYERLLADTGGELTRILAVLGEAIDANRVADAVARCSIENLRALEESESRAGARGLFPGGPEARARGHRFMNKGASGQSLAHIAPDLDEMFDAAFAPALAACGYA